MAPVGFALLRNRDGNGPLYIAWGFGKAGPSTVHGSNLAEHSTGRTLRNRYKGAGTQKEKADPKKRSISSTSRNLPVFAEGIPGGKLP